MDAEIMSKLREKFDVTQIGLKPKITCKACSDSRSKACEKHPKARCESLRGGPGCGQWITPQHMHVEFVSHADVTDRLLSVDPEWTWEPVAFAPTGLPALTPDGGLWIRLTVAGVTRIGYGGADGKTGDDAVKEAVSDAIKVTAMRFGVALDLWRKSEVSGKQPEDPALTAALERVWSTCDDNGWDRDRVSAVFAKAAGVPIEDATDAARLAKFREYLFTLPQTELQPVAATNGAAQ